MRDTSERLESKRLIEVLIDVLDNPVHSGRVLGAAVFSRSQGISPAAYRRPSSRSSSAG
jgi:hypothetical protein